MYEDNTEPMHLLEVSRENNRSLTKREKDNLRSTSGHFIWISNQTRTDMAFSIHPIKLHPRFHIYLDQSYKENETD